MMADAPIERKTPEKNKTELQIEAPIEETTNKGEDWFRKTGKSITSAISLRGRGLFFFIKRRQRVKRRQELSSDDGSICGLWSERRGEPEEIPESPNEFL